MKKFTFRAILMMALFSGSFYQTGWGQVQLAAWTFDATPAAPLTPTSIAANLGIQLSSTFNADGTNGSSTWLSTATSPELTAFAGSTLNDPRGTPIAGMAITLANTTANGKSIVIKFSMTGYADPILTFATRGTSTGFNTHQWAWSTDNATYTNFGTNTAVTATTFSLKTLDMSTINELDNASTVYLRLTVSGASSAAGNNRLDNIVLNATSASSIATPIISPASGIFESPITVTITCATPGSSIFYTTDGSNPTDLSTPYPTGGFTVSTTTPVRAIAYVGTQFSSIALETYRFPINVSTVAQLRAGITDGNTVYKLTGEAVVTFSRPAGTTGRNQKYIQDATGAVVVDDPSTNLTTPYIIGDGMTGLKGTLMLFSSLLEFVPVSDPGPPSSTGHTIVPEVKTLSSLTTNDQAKLVSVSNVSFTAPTGNFVAATNYPVTDVSKGAGNLYTNFAEVDYIVIPTPVPVTPVNIVALVGQSGTAIRITPRSSADITSPAAPPALSVNPTSLSGFEYFLGGGPSTVKPFAITGTNLTPASGSITVTAQTNFQVSNGVDGFGTSANISYTGGALTAVNVNVRLKAGLPIGSYTDILTISGGGVSDLHLTCTGDVFPVAPYITVGSLTGFGNQLVNTFSALQYYIVAGYNLTGNIEITPPSGFWISTTPTGSYTPYSIILIPPDEGYVPNTPIFVKFYPTAVQPYAGNITHATPGGTTQNVAVSGTGVLGEPTNHVTNFTAGTATSTDIPLTWTDATGGTLPEAYLIKVSATSYEAIADPVDGTPETNSALVQNVLQGVGTFTFTGLTPVTPYYFKIYPYNNSGSGIDYKTSPVAPEATATTTEPPVNSYAWIGPDRGLWTDAANWNPARTTPQVTDILWFNDGTTKIIQAVPTQTIGRLLMTNSTAVNLHSAAAVTLTISGGTGIDLAVSTGCA